MVKVTKMMVPSNLASKLTYSGTFNKTHIVCHETANKAKGAGATTHARLQANGNSRAASWQYQTDDKHAVQSFPDKAGCWHASNPTYNKNSIGIEICVNSDSDYKKAVKNAAELTKSLMKKHGIPAKNVIQHYTASGGKNCPAQMRSGNHGVTWNQFKKMIGASSGETSSGGSSSSKSSSGKSKSIPKMADEVMAGKHGSGHDNRRKSLGISKSEYEKVRSEVNKRAGSSKPKSSGKSISTMAKEVLAGKHGSGHANRQKSLGISKSQYEKVRSEVNKQSGGGSSSGGGKSISTMANEVLAGKHGSGHANRRKSLGVNKATYEKVRAQVNKGSGGGSSKSSGKTVNQMANEIINGKGIPQGHEARRKHFGITKAKYEQVRKEVNRRL